MHCSMWCDGLVHQRSTEQIARWVDFRGFPIVAQPLTAPGGVAVQLQRLAPVRSDRYGRGVAQIEDTVFIRETNGRMKELIAYAAAELRPGGIEPCRGLLNDDS
jgi:hypothetical protein